MNGGHRIQSFGRCGPLKVHSAWGATRTARMKREELMPFEIQHWPEVINVDMFCGGGLVSAAMKEVHGRDPEVAINHWECAIAMHEANHPDTLHIRESVSAIDPKDATFGRQVGHLHMSPDCTHHSKARGSKPVRKEIRGLANVGIHWVDRLGPKAPTLITLENVEEFRDWGPVIQKRKMPSGLRFKADMLNDGTYEDLGEPVFDGNGNPIMIPDPRHKGKYFNQWVAKLRRRGYSVEHRILRACDYGDPTIRKRLFVVARRDGQPIKWPAPTHGDPKSLEVQTGRLLPYRTAADIIDFSQPCPSIFMTKEEAEIYRQVTGRRVIRPLAEKTMARIARGFRKFVIENPTPFIIKPNHGGQEFRGQGIDEPLQTQTGKGQYAVVTPYLTEHANGSGQRVFDATQPLRTITGVKGGHFAVVEPILERQEICAAWMAKHFGGMTGCAADTPLPTTTTRGTQNQIAVASMIKYHGKSTGSDMAEPMRGFTGKDSDGVVTSQLLSLRGTCKDGPSIEAPLPTQTASGYHEAEARAYMIKYYGDGGQDQDLFDPLHSLTARARFGIVYVYGEPYKVVDIGMRMLTPEEQFAAHSAPEDYEINFGADGRALAKTTKTKLAGNSVPKKMAEAVIGANADFDETRMAA